VKLTEIAEEIIRQGEGGVLADESKYDQYYVYNMVHDARAYVLRQDFLKYRRWAPLAIQTFNPVYEEQFQLDACYTRFNLPCSFIQGDSRMDGLVYFGGEQLLHAQDFKRIKNRQEMADLVSHPVMKPGVHYTAVMLEGLVATVISREPITQYPVVAGVFDDPTAIQGYSIENDQYPMPEDLIDVMIDVIFKGTMKYVMVRQADTLSDSAQTIEQRGGKR